MTYPVLPPPDPSALPPLKQARPGRPSERIAVDALQDRVLAPTPATG